MKTGTRQPLDVSLPERFTARGAGLDDLEPALDLINTWSRSVIGEAEIADGEAIRNEWLSPGFDPAADVRLIFAPNGEMAGCVEVWTTHKPPVHPWIWGRVHPTHEGMGIGSWMLQWAEQRALQALPELADDLRFATWLGAFRQADAARELFEHHGYRHIRSAHQMRVELDSSAGEVVWPEGLTLRPFNPARDAEAVYCADVDSLRDQYGFVEEPFDEGFARFKHSMMNFEGFDPTLWFLAMAGEEIAGISLCRFQSPNDPDPELGWVSALGVRRPWRRRGLGLALLRHSFNELHRRGKRRAGLGVDAENITGALRLYKRAGMRVHRSFDFFEKELRAGREISVQSLSQ